MSRLARMCHDRQSDSDLWLVLILREPELTMNLIEKHLESWVELNAFAVSFCDHDLLGRRQVPQEDLQPLALQAVKRSHI